MLLCLQVRKTDTGDRVSDCAGRMGQDLWRADEREYCGAFRRWWYALRAVSVVHTAQWGARRLAARVGIARVRTDVPRRACGAAAEIHRAGLRQDGAWRARHRHRGGLLRTDVSTRAQLTATRLAGIVDGWEHAHLAASARAGTDRKAVRVPAAPSRRPAERTAPVLRRVGSFADE